MILAAMPRPSYSILVTIVRSKTLFKTGNYSSSKILLQNLVYLQLRNPVWFTLHDILKYMIQLLNINVLQSFNLGTDRLRDQ